MSLQSGRLYGSRQRDVLEYQARPVSVSPPGMLTLLPAVHGIDACIEASRTELDCVWTPMSRSGLRLLPTGTECGESRRPRDTDRRNDDIRRTQMLTNGLLRRSRRSFLHRKVAWQAAEKPRPDRKWQMGEGKLLGFSISHLRFAIQDAFFSILLG
jgi:hypothetical protein